MGVVRLQISQFALIYALLLIVLFIRKKYKVDQTKLLIVSSMKMTLQLFIAGFILTYIFKNPSPIYTIAYLCVMTGFTIYRVLSDNKGLNSSFKRVISISIALSGLFIIFYFIYIVVGESILNPQYIIPISGMVMGNIMTATSLGIKTFREALNGQRAKINALLSVGASAEKYFHPLHAKPLKRLFYLH